MAVPTRFCSFASCVVSRVRTSQANPAKRGGPGRCADGEDGFCGAAAGGAAAQGARCLVRSTPSKKSKSQGGAFGLSLLRGYPAASPGLTMIFVVRAKCVARARRAFDPWLFVFEAEAVTGKTFRNCSTSSWQNSRSDTKVNTEEIDLQLRGR